MVDKEAPNEIAFLSKLMLELWQQRDPFRAGPFGFEDAMSKLPRYDLAERVRRELQLRNIAAQAAEIDPGSLNSTDQSTREVLIEQASSAAEMEALSVPSFTVNLPREFSTASVVRGMMKAKVRDSETAMAYLTRLSSLPAFVATDLDLLRSGVIQGRPALRRALEVTLAELRSYLDTDLESDPLLAVSSGEWEGESAWRSHVQLIIEQGLRPQLEQFVQGIEEEILPVSRGDDKPGVCWLADGEAIYAAFLREETTLSLDFRRLHENGLQKMTAVHEHISRLGEQTFNLKVPREILQALRDDTEYVYPSGVEALAEAKVVSQKVQEALPQWFSRKFPTLPTEAMPEATALHYGGGQYMPGTADGTRAGVFYVNTTSPRSTHELAAMVSGGGSPGSHVFWEYAFAADVPEFRRVAFVPAFVKGWAAYGGQLAHEMNLFTKPITELGYWAKQAANLSRQVVDTGVHGMGWSHETALVYLVDNTALSLRDAETELSRIISMPGEGPIFSFGSEKFFELRCLAEGELGSDFDIREFHHELLQNGALPLTTMRKNITSWVESKVND